MKLSLPIIALLLFTSGAVYAAEPQQVALLKEGKTAAATETPSPWSRLNPRKLKLRSTSALVLDESGRVVYAKEAETPRAIASITKLMTAMVILDSGLPMDEKIKITKADRDLLRLTGSRLEPGARLTRKNLIRLALMASENRAASALARTYPGGTEAFIAAMNRKAKSLGMSESHFADAAGLAAENRASARDLARLVTAASDYPLIREATTTRSLTVRPYSRRGPLKYANTNRLLKNDAWEIELSKTGYINEAGRCLVMRAQLAGESMVIVLLDSFGKLTPFGDSNRLRKWINAGL